MPWKPLSHSQRLGRSASDRAYAQTRRQTPALAEAKRIRSSQRWREVRALVLARQPLCADIWGRHKAEGRVEVATQVDHIKPLVEHPELAYDVEWLQALCTACHARKSIEERRQCNMKKGASLPSGTQLRLLG